MNNDKKVVFISGCSSGHGKFSAKLFARNGYDVCAGMRDTGGKHAAAKKELEDYARDMPGRIMVVDLDVTSDAEVSAAVAECLKRYERIDVVINNAGLVGIGWQEEFSIEQFQHVMDVVLYGAQRIYKAVLPHMRGRKSGLFLNVTTIGARLAMPLRQGPYTCAKWALEALSERYHQELSDIFNIDSVCIQPSPTSGTKLLENSFLANDPAVRAGYPPFSEDRFYRIWAELAAQMKANLVSDDIDNVASKMFEVAQTPHGQRPVRVAVRTRSILGYHEVCEMNATFEANQKKLEEKWLRGDIAEFWEKVV